MPRTVGPVSVEPTADQAASAATSEAAAGETKPGAQPRLSAPAAEGAEPDAVTVARSRLDELERTANELEDQALAAQGRLATLAKQARARAEEEETTLVAGMVPWARREALAIVEDARRRAAELGSTDAFPIELGDIGGMLVSHFELQERLVRLIAEEVAPNG